MPHDFPGTHHHQVTVRRRHQHFPPLWRPTGIGALQAAPTSPEGHKAILRHRRDHHLCGMASHGWSKLRVFWWRVLNVSDICGIWMNLVCFLLAGFCCRCFCIGCEENVSPRAGPTYVCDLWLLAWLEASARQAAQALNWLRDGSVGSSLEVCICWPRQHMNSPFDVGTWVKCYGENLGGWWLQATWNHLGLCFENLSETTH